MLSKGHLLIWCQDVRHLEHGSNVTHATRDGPVGMTIPPYPYSPCNVITSHTCPAVTQTITWQWNSMKHQPFTSMIFPPLLVAALFSVAMCHDTGATGEMVPKNERRNAGAVWFVEPYLGNHHLPGRLVKNGLFFEVMTADHKKPAISSFQGKITNGIWMVPNFSRTKSWVDMQVV